MSKKESPVQKSEKIYGTIEVETTRFKYLPKSLRVIVLLAGVVGIFLCVLQAFTISINGFVFFQKTFFYILFSIFASVAFLLLPARKKDRQSLPWYDLLIFLFLLGSFIYYARWAWDIAMVGWVPTTMTRTIIAGLTVVAILEAARRTGGLPYMIVCVVLGAFPLYSGLMPGALYAPALNLRELIAFNVFGSTGITGLPAQVVGTLIIGYLIFAAVLLASGAGQFFIEISLAILGKFRGGPAKVAVISSALFGSLSGSGVSNIMATGAVTIPTMKRMGFSSEFAGAVEACASTGGVLLPPIMGSVAFVMAVFLGIPYYQVAIAAFIPGLLYFFSLLMQVDSYAAKHGLQGLPKAELPSFWKVLKNGWHFIIVLVFLVWALVVMQMGVKAPYYATIILLGLSFLRKDTRITWQKALKILSTIVSLVAQTMAIIIPIGIIVCGLTVNGVAGSLTAVALTLGQNNALLILVIGVVICYIMGMVGLVTPAYIFLAISFAPAVIDVYPAINVVALHLFIVYYSIIAAITPPVAAGAFVASTIANSNPMKTSLQSMRLGIIIYLVPFFFIYNPNLILQGMWYNIILYIVLCILGIIAIAGGVEGYMVGMGRVSAWKRILLVVGGFTLALPEWRTSLTGAAILAVLFAINFLTKRSRLKKAESTP